MTGRRSGLLVGIFRKRGWIILSAVGVVCLWLLLYRQWNFETERIDSARFALQCVLEAVHQVNVHHTLLALRLVGAASAALGQTALPVALSSIPALEQTALARTVPNAFASPEMDLAVTWLLALLAIVSLHIWKERTIGKIAQEQELLRDKLLAISGGWMLATVKPGSVREVVANILDQVIRYTDIRAVDILRVTDKDRTFGLRSFCSGGASLLRDHRDIPRALLQSPYGSLQQVMETRRPFFSGVHGELGAILPGVRLPSVAVYPLVDRDTVWGVMLLQGQGAHWNAQLEDLITIVAKEIAILLAYGDMEEHAIKAARYQEMDRLKTELLANVSHELRTPLGLIRGYAETLLYKRSHLQPDQVAEFTQVIVDESAGLETQIDKLLKMSILETAGAPVRCVRFTLDQWLPKIRRRLLTNSRISLITEGDSEIDVKGDPELLLDAVSNLVENAVKYSFGPIDIIISTLAPSLRVAVVDTGPGVPQADLTQIFERFYRSGVHAQSETRGSGLGLSIVKSIVDAHHGFVWARNRSPGFEIGFELPHI